MLRVHLLCYQRVVRGFSEGLRFSGLSFDAAALDLVDVLRAVDHHFAHCRLDLGEL